MNATAINNSEAIPNIGVEDLKLKQLEMKFEEQKLHIKLSAPFLNAFNHWCVFKNNILIIKVMPKSSMLKPDDAPFEIPLYVPKKGYTKIVKRFFENQTLHLELEKDTSSIN